MVVLAIRDEVVRPSHVSFLKRHGFTVLVTGDTSEAIDLTMRFLPEITVLDLGGGGLEPVRRLRTHSLTSSIGIVALGAAWDDAATARAQAAGCDVVLETPCAPETLLTELLVLLADLVPDTGAAPATFG
jgi:DNA-binding response OmpR family regulator